jgi:signal transduction histidine kinase/ligand-binding sensor domain-containing protein
MTSDRRRELTWDGALRILAGDMLPCLRVPAMPWLLRSTTLFCATLAALLQPVLPASGQDRLIRRFGSVDGLQIGSVQKLAQDDRGFLWIGGVSGLRRWDGLELRRWQPDRIDGWVIEMARCPDGRLFAIEEGGSLFEITESGAREVPTPPEISDALTAECDADGGLWVAGSGDLRLMAPDGSWQTVDSPVLRDRRPKLVPGPTAAGAWLATADGLWLLSPGRDAMPVSRLPDVVALAKAPANGDTLVLTRSVGLHRMRHGGASVVIDGGIGRGISMVVRGGTCWVAFDRSLVAIREGEPPEVLGSDLIPEGGGPLLVDHEGSLWLGTFSGLLVFPEPETTFWNDRHGLPSAHTRFLARQGRRVWVSSWQGLGFVERRNGRWRAASRLDIATAWSIHTDASGTLWIPAADGVLAIDPEGTVTNRGHGGLIAWDIEDEPGGVWLATNEGLMSAAKDRLDVQPAVNSPFGSGEPVRQVLRSRDGRIWLGGDETVCGTRDPVGSHELPREWNCDSIPGAVEITGLVEMRDGEVWASSSRLGVLRLRDGRWERHPGSAGLSSLATYRLVPARDGSVWILGFSTPIRVVERPDADPGWEVVEQLSAWQGIASDAQDLIEDDKGALWLATSLGLARVPAAARGTLAPPVVALVDVRVDGGPAGAGPTRLRHHHNRVDLRWTALSYRDPGRIRYQVRLAPGDWRQHTGSPSFGWIDLPEGEYTAEVRASLDGERWTDPPATFAWAVLAPWYLQSWAFALGALALALAMFTAYRLRVAVLLRLERQRTRIAMDLHDELGSALGSIGILSGVLRDERLQANERAKLTDRIAETAGELGASLSDIVWSLEAGTRTIDELVGRLTEHGSRLFASDDVRFDVALDETDAATLDFDVFRAVLLIGLEAMHNIARHAAARNVRLSVEATDANTRVLVIEDDGRGLPDQGRSDGLGLSSMRRRADGIGAHITWSSPRAGGTRVTLRFRTSARTA